MRLFIWVSFTLLLKEKSSYENTALLLSTNGMFSNDTCKTEVENRSKKNRYKELRIQNPSESFCC